MAEEYWVLKRYKPLISICYHGKANMQGIAEAEKLLQMPYICYYLKGDTADLIRKVSDRESYMGHLKKYVLQKPRVINEIMKEGLRLSDEIKKLIKQIEKTDLKKCSNGELKSLLLDFDRLVPASWLRSTFIPYYVGDIAGFDKKLNLEYIRLLRLETAADLAIPSMILLSKEILERAGVKTKYPQCATFDELIEILNGGKLEPNLLTARFKECFIEITPKSFKITTGKEAGKKAADIFKVSGEINELKGMVAFEGSISSKVFVTNDPGELKNMQKGSIIVTHMTTPDFVPYLKKAAGIITDEGGITCHAAIISREMEIPCIIGTKHATRLLKTGDYVEIDGKSGIIRKI